jgi:all-trans-retinol 13,14-reductase
MAATEPRGGNPMDFDAIVIGSGVGGLTAALSLQRAGKRTLVLEQHYLPGGWCHTFDLGGYRFSPGVHYLGELGPGGRFRALIEGLGIGGDLELGELNPEGYDHMIVAGERFDIPRGRERYADRLKARFPREAAGIDAILGDAARLSKELETIDEFRFPWDIARLPFKAPTVARWGMRTAASLIDHHVRDPRLRAILAGQSGDHGLPPSLAPAPVHAAVMAHYFDGGYYPRGGGGSIPRAYIRALRRAGGAIRVRATVERILVERGPRGPRAVGVRLAGGEEIRAGIVISNADPGITFGRLVPREHQGFFQRLRLARARWSVSAISLFLAVDMDLRAAGLDSGNFWFYAHDDVDAIYRLGMDARAVEENEVAGFFLTVTTLKDPTKKKGSHHTLESFAFVPYEPFRAWAASRQGERPEGYEALKRELKGRMLRAIARLVPGIERHVVFSDLGTPLTNEHYVASTRGCLYGTEKGRFQVGPFSWPVKTSIGGLYLCGASTLSHGVFGAALSGLVAAARALRCRSRDLLDAGGPPPRMYPCEDPAAWPMRAHAAPASRSPRPAGHA